MPKRPIFIAALLLTLALAGFARAEISQKGDVQVTVSGRMTPHNLPRSTAAPIAVSIAGHVTTTDGTPPPQLKKLEIEINRNGRLDYQGLPVCSISAIQPASTQRALAACRSSLVGQGRFWANIALKGQALSPTQGRLLVFNGREGGRPVLFGHIYDTQPFTSSFVIVFRIAKVAHGPFGTSLTASLPEALGNWGDLTGIEMRLSRHYFYRGARHSYLSAACAAPSGLRTVPFSLTRTSFGFAGGKTLSSTLTRTCGVRG